jgi:hypothetical protein
MLAEPGHPVAACPATSTLSGHCSLLCRPSPCPLAHAAQSHGGIVNNRVESSNLLQAMQGTRSRMSDEEHTETGEVPGRLASGKTKVDNSDLRFILTVQNPSHPSRGGPKACH